MDLEVFVYFMGQLNMLLLWMCETRWLFSAKSIHRTKRKQNKKQVSTYSLLTFVAVIPMYLDSSICTARYKTIVSHCHAMNKA